MSALSTSLFLSHTCLQISLDYQYKAPTVQFETKVRESKGPWSLKGAVYTKVAKEVPEMVWQRWSQ